MTTTTSPVDLRPEVGDTPDAYGPRAPRNAAGDRSDDLRDRFVARLVDLVLCSMLSGLTSTALLLVVPAYVVVGVAAPLLDAGVALGYFALTEARAGRTVGKRLMGLRVVGPDHRLPPGPWRAVRRNLWTAAPVLRVVPGVGWLVAGLVELAAVLVCAVGIRRDPAGRTRFDRLAGGTSVVAARPGGR